MGLPVARLPGGRIRSRTITPGPKPFAWLLLQIGEDSLIVGIVEFLIRKIDFGLGMVPMDDSCHFFDGLDKSKSVGFAFVAFASTSVASPEFYQVEGRPIPEIVVTQLEHVILSFRNGEAYVTGTADGLLCLPFQGNLAGSSVGTEFTLGHQTKRFEEIIFGAITGGKNIGSGQGII